MKRLAIGMVSGIVVLAIGCAPEESLESSSETNELPGFPMPGKPAPKAGKVAQLDAPLPQDSSRLDSKVVELVKNATVLIGNFEGGSLTSTGSGFVVGDGKRVVTNKHVATGTDDKPDALKLVFRSGTDKARIVQVAPKAVKLYGSLSRSDKTYHKEDLAFITIGALVAEPIKVVEDEPLQETTPVWAFGFPRGTNILSGLDMPSATVHTLRIERVEREKEVVTMLQLSGSPTYGNSGGPVVDAEGKVLGVIQAKTPEAPILFAIPSVRVTKMLAGKQPTTKSIAELWKKPIGDPSPPKKVAKRSSGYAGDPGPRQSYASVLNGSYLTESDVESLSARELTFLRNEPFARRGYIFNRSDLNRMYAGIPWYSPRTRNLNAVQRLLTRREARNIDFIKAYQSRTGQNY